MNDYWDKLEKLPAQRLEMLVKLYQKTIHGLEQRLREATIVGMTKDMEYCQRELTLKRPELAQIEKLLQVKRNQNA